MFLVQLALTVLFWAATIALLVRRRERLIDASRAHSRNRRSLEAMGLLLGSIVVLGLTMVVLAHGGLANGALTPFGWFATTLAGTAFVTLQTLALVPLVLNAVTPEAVGSSDRKEPTPL